MKLTVPIRAVSEANASEHWRVKHKRHRQQQQQLSAAWIAAGAYAKPPCSVTLSRIAPRKLDSDNLILALKWIRDCVADLLIPGLRPGRADDDPRIAWHYQQLRGAPREYAIAVEILAQ